ncbi:MAG: hypothetical protein J5795_03025 [Lachnospiraceae bacterium]|nr:hypothetical protein [Lachnospiraceae bacterium]
MDLVPHIQKFNGTKASEKQFWFHLYRNLMVPNQVRSGFSSTYTEIQWYQSKRKAVLVPNHGNPICCPAQSKKAKQRKNSVRQKQHKTKTAQGKNSTRQKQHKIKKQRTRGTLLSLCHIH